ncbi:MAG: restriction endonuclease [Anaerolineae bacterium]|nr:restriction endonuclease [Anaerolineae bacterium]
MPLRTSTLLIAVWGLLCLGSLYWILSDTGLAGGLLNWLGWDGAAILAAKLALWVALAAISGGIGLLSWRRLTEKPPQPFEFETQPARPHVPTEFEYEVAKLIQMLSGYRTLVKRGTSDRGIDILIFDERERMIGIVQCKRYAPDRIVPPAHIRALNAVRHYHSARFAYLVTTGRFDKASYRLAQGFNIRLIDGALLNKLRKRAARKHKSPAPSS